MNVKNVDLDQVHRGNQLKELLQNPHERQLLDENLREWKLLDD
jgi:hypothetical protein